MYVFYELLNIDLINTHGIVFIFSFVKPRCLVIIRSTIHWLKPRPNVVVIFLRKWWVQGFSLPSDYWIVSSDWDCYFVPLPYHINGLSLHNASTRPPDILYCVKVFLRLNFASYPTIFLVLRHDNDPNICGNLVTVRNCITAANVLWTDCAFVEKQN